MQNTNEYVTDLGHLHLRIEEILDERGSVTMRTVRSSGHAWNLVKVGGKWLHVDVTFDDPIVNGKNTNTRPRYTYFLKTDAQMRKDHAW